MSATKQDFARLIRELGYRMTPQRQLILDAISAANGHTTVNELYERVHARAPAVNRATVYRTVNFLRDLGFVTGAELHGRVVYEMADPEPHHHLVCRHCGRVTMLADAHLQDLVHHIRGEHDFIPEIEHLTISGLCVACVPAGTTAPGASE